jgi:hypothetical protein
MAWMLPIVRYEGKRYFFDGRLRQIRNLENPHDYMDLDDFEMYYFINIRKVGKPREIG